MLFRSFRLALRTPDSPGEKQVDVCRILGITVPERGEPGT